MAVQPTPKTTLSKKKKCTVGKSFPCGYSCQAISRKCRNPLKGQAADYQSWLEVQTTRITKIDNYLDKRKKRGQSSSSATTSVGASATTATDTPTARIKRSSSTKSKSSTTKPVDDGTQKLGRKTRTRQGKSGEGKNKPQPLKEIAKKDREKPKTKTKAQLAKEAKKAQEKLDRANFEEKITQREKAINDSNGEILSGAKMSYEIKPVKKDGYIYPSFEAKSFIRQEGGQTYKVAVTLKPEDGKYDLDFMINDKYDQVDMSRELSSRTVSHIKFNIDRAMKEVPPGSIIVNIPYKEDGLGDKRAAIYRRVGFVEDGLRQVAIWTGSKFVDPSKYEGKGKIKVDTAILENLFD